MEKDDLSWDKICLNNAAKNFFDSFIPNIYEDILIVAISKNDEKKSFVLLSDGEDKIDFSGVISNGEELYKSSPEFNIGHSNPSYNERYHKRAENKYLSESIRQYTQKFYDKHIVITSNFFYIPEDEDNFYILGVKLDKDMYNSYKKFTYENLYRIKISRSIVDFASNVFLQNAISCFQKNYYDILEDIEYLKKQTGSSFFCNIIEWNMEGIHSVFNNINLISQMKYESVEAIGNLIISKEDCLDIKYELKFSERYSLSNIRLIRKLLELTNNELFLITDGAYVYGVGKKKKNSLSSDLFKVKVNGNYSWSLFFDDILIINYDFGIPKIPKVPLDDNFFTKKMRRCFNSISNKSIKNIYDCILSLIDQKKGAILVISKKAKYEAKRLEKQGILVNPQKMNKNNIKNLSSIDGAILINDKCICYAIGVILDGESSGNGSIDRGSRYNSSLRYCMHRRKVYKEEVAAIVISEDGMINVLPELKDYMYRSELNDILNNYLSISEYTDVKKIYNIMDLIFNKYRYYFNQNQCININKKKEEIYKILEKKQNGYFLYEDIHQYEEFDENLIKD